MPNSAASFKGIALFTPGGDLVYCIDPGKQGQWHAQLCQALQQALHLTEPPYFLVPCYTATVDRWFDAEMQQWHVFAELAMNVKRYQVLLNRIFHLEDYPEPVQWQTLMPPVGVCDPLLLHRYRLQFPALWESHNLAIGLDATGQIAPPETVSGYVLRLFVAGYSGSTEKTLEGLHHVLEESLNLPYTLTVVDVFKQPEEAEVHQITAIPTLMKIYPPPIKRLVGDLDTGDRLLKLLGIPHFE
jgi:circadian clock protein KaiB